MKTTIQHPIFGRITYDDVTERVSIEHGNLAGRIRWLLKPKNSALLGHGYFPDRFLRACEVLGIMHSAQSIKTTRRRKSPRGTVYSAPR